VNAEGFIWVRDYTAVEYDQQGSAKTIKGYLVDNTTEIEAQKEAQRASHTDFLTNLSNRQKLQLDIKKKNPYGCVVFNIHRFREINDLFGITVGDSLLVQIAHWFTTINLNVYRIGGDEFAMLLYEKTTWKLLESNIEQWLEQLSQTFFHIQNELISIRMNIGVALGGEKLLTEADIALHNAKEAKTPYALYTVTENIEEIYRNNIAMTATIHKAIAEKNIVCYYQPIVDFATGQIKKYETLVRLIDESQSIIAPLIFLPIAKKTKLYAQITRSVVSQACELFQNRKEEFSINISIDDVEDPVTVQYIVNTLLKTDTASHVVFEILESEGIENYESVQYFITQVKALGAKIAIDDFGTGYSNFEHILNLHVDYIKIDGSLVRGIVGNERYKIIVETIVDFARKIGAKTIAEFVSDEAIFEELKSLGVDYSQGYYTGKPEPLL
jgi:diguanylate cyclase (GGDEF)-like protein